MHANRARRECVEYYRRLIEDGGWLDMPFARRRTDETSAHHLCVAMLRPGADRDAIRARLSDAGIQTSVHYPPVHRLSAHYAGTAELQHTEAAASGLLSLPLSGHMSREDIEFVVNELVAAVRAHPH
jgi:dTDP-4-amino-4,6-dideoxygalactose transaminase